VVSVIFLACKSKRICSKTFDLDYGYHIIVSALAIVDRGMDVDKKCGGSVCAFSISLDGRTDSRIAVDPSRCVPKAGGFPSQLISIYKHFSGDVIEMASNEIKRDIDYWFSLYF
jgi:hypothetical protein